MMNCLVEEYDMMPSGSVVLCAVSGGADSVYLLHRLWLLRDVWNIRLIAAHYNHQLRGAESDRDEQFVRQFVKKFCGEQRFDSGVTLPAVELIVGSGDVRQQAAQRKQGLEETARNMRYAFLEETAQVVGANVIATAHNANDNVETLLLHLLRGTGLHGLAGMAPRRGKVVRPLLTTSRAEIEEYLRLYSLPHVEDSSNSDDAYTRNRVRHQLIPMLEAWSPGFQERLADAFPILRADDNYLDAQALQMVRHARQEGEDLVIDARLLSHAPSALASRCARILLEKMGNVNCTAAHVNGIVALCRGDNPSAELALPHGLTAGREYESLRLTRAPPPLPLTVTPLNFQGLTAPENSLWGCFCARSVCPSQQVNQVWYLRWDALSPGAVLRPRQTGDRLTLPNRGTRTLKKHFIDAKIPRIRREQIPVLSDERGVIGVAGFGCDASRLARPGEKAWCVTFLKRNKEKDGELL